MDDKQLIKQVRVLYVEDEEDVRISLGKFLRRRCKEVYEAQNGQEGLELFKKYTPDIVISDIEMPVMNGLEMIKQILMINAHQPVIITTGYDDPHHKSDKVCINLIKPVNNEELIDSIIMCMNKASK